MKPGRPAPAEFTGEFASEICLPVRVRYRVAADGRTEVTHVALESTAMLERPAPLLWPRLPLQERLALEVEAAADAAQAEDTGALAEGA